MLPFKNMSRKLVGTTVPFWLRVPGLDSMSVQPKMLHSLPHNPDSKHKVRTVEQSICFLLSPTIDGHKPS